jgi:hypothetical protein
MPTFCSRAREAEERRLKNPPSVAPGYILRASSTPPTLTGDTKPVALGQPLATMMAVPSLVYEDKSFSLEPTRT